MREIQQRSVKRWKMDEGGKVDTVTFQESLHFGQMGTMLGDHNIFDFFLQQVQPVVNGGHGVHTKRVYQHQQDGHQCSGRVGDLPRHTCAAPANDHLIFRNIAKSVINLSSIICVRRLSSDTTDIICLLHSPPPVSPILRR